MNENENRDFVSRALEDPAMRREMEYEWFVDEIIVRIERVMDKKDISRTELANKLKCTPANVTQLLRHGSNLTLKSLVDIALALDHRFIAPNLVPVTEAAPWESHEVCSLYVVSSKWVEAEGLAFSLCAFPNQAYKAEAKPIPYDLRQTGEFNVAQ